MKRPKNCKRCGGKMQMGGIPRQQDFPDYESWQEAMANFMPKESVQPKIDLSAYMPPPIVEGNLAVGRDIPPDNNVIDLPHNYNSDQLYNFTKSSADKKRQPQTPKKWSQNLGLGISAISTLMSEISNKVARSRQNEYDYMQQSALGMMNPMPVDDYQPNPYSLYAKYGGSLKKYGGLQHHKYFGPPFSNGAEYKFPDSERYDKTIVSRKLLPQLFLRQFINGKMYRNGGINIKPENKGKFTDYCGGKVTGDCIEKGLDSPSSVIRKRAQFAKNARSWNK